LLHKIPILDRRRAPGGPDADVFCNIKRNLVFVYPDQYQVLLSLLLLLSPLHPCLVLGLWVHSFYQFE
jgi:hypothetical protein